jgi:pimeloyl-ACP methyl ester carboxylesterase
MSQTHQTLSFIQAGAHRVCYVEGGNDGTGKKPKVLLGHGWIASHQLYRNVWAELAEVCHYRALDLVGFGDSDKPDPKTTPYNPAWYGAQLEAFLDASGWDSAVVAVQSMGGMAGVELALRAPKRVEKLILIDAAGIARFGNALGTIVLTEMVTQNVTEMYTGDRKLIGTEQLQWLQDQLGKRRLRAVLGGKLLHVGPPFDKGEALHQLEPWPALQPWPARRLACGDSENDRTLLEGADIALVFHPADRPPLRLHPAPPGRPRVERAVVAAGPRAWLTAVETALEQLTP